MNTDPFTTFGQDIRNLENRKADKHELNSTNSNVDSLERSLREISAKINGLCDEVLQLQQKVIDLQNLKQ